MTALSSAPKGLSTTTTLALQYDTEQNIHYNIAQLYERVYLNNQVVLNDLQSHIDWNSQVEVGAIVLTGISLFLCGLPLYSTLSVVLLVIAVLLQGIAIAAWLHSFTLEDLYIKHDRLDKTENRMFSQGSPHRSLFQSNENLILKKIQQSFDEKVIDLTSSPMIFR